MRILKVDEGVRKSKSKYIFDMSNDEITDLINTVISNELYFHSFDDNGYYFGYKFNENTSKKQRTDFIKWLKGQENLSPEIESFIIRPIKTLKNEFDFNDFNLIVYPKSERSRLTNLIINCISNVVGRGVGKKSIEVLKELPNKVYFDYEMLKFDKGIDETDKQFKDITDYVDNKLLPSIHKLQYFSLSDNVKVKYRKYIQNYLRVDANSSALIEQINNGNILIIDDINTSGATLREIIRIIREINKDCNIFIYTLIGK